MQNKPIPSKIIPPDIPNIIRLNFRIGPPTKTSLQKFQKLNALEIELSDAKSRNST